MGGQKVQGKYIRGGPEMNETKKTINRFLAQATIETVASFTVGVAANDNTEIGTGTLVSFDGQKFILTAKHVIQNAKDEELRFWLRPPAPIIEKAVKDTTAE